MHEATKECVEKRKLVYGEPTVTFPAVESIHRQLIALRAHAGRATYPGEDHALQQIIMKLVRREASPSNMDHYDDVIGYTDILRALIKEGDAPCTHAKPVSSTCNEHPSYQELAELTSLNSCL